MSFSRSLRKEAERKTAADEKYTFILKYEFLDFIIMDLLGVGSKPEIDFILDPKDERKQIEVRTDDPNKRVMQYIYYDGEDVSGTVSFHRFNDDVKRIFLEKNTQFV